MPGDIETALWRSADVILGSLLALLFCSIYPQRAYSHWRLQMHDTLQQAQRLYHTHLSPTCWSDHASPTATPDCSPRW